MYSVIEEPTGYIASQIPKRSVESGRSKNRNALIPIPVKMLVINFSIYLSLTDCNISTVINLWANSLCACSTMASVNLAIALTPDPAARDQRVQLLAFGHEMSEP